MIVTRELMRKLTYVSADFSNNTMGYVTIEKVTSEELPNWKIYQYEHVTTIKTETTSGDAEEAEGFIESTTKHILDYHSYGAAFLAYVNVLNNHRYIDGQWRVGEELANGHKYLNGELQKGASND